MKKGFAFCLVFLIFQFSNAQNISLWIPFYQTVSEALKIRNGDYSLREKKFTLNHEKLRELLAEAPEKSSGRSGKIITFPTFEGHEEYFEVWENSNFVPELQSKYPDIRAYVGRSINDPAAKIHFSFSSEGIQTMTLRPNTGSEFIEPYTKDHRVYVLFDSATRISPELAFECSGSHEQSNLLDPVLRSDNQVYKTMRLALSCTGEYGQYFGGTISGALAAMNATMTRVNGVFETDLALHLNLIAQTDTVIYTDPTSDPYSPANLRSNWNNEVQQTLSSILGDESFDIGHLFGASGGGGDAGCLGCVCDTGKGRGYTSPSNSSPIPQGDFFDIDYVAHEIGHQLGGNHTFSYLFEGTGVNVEPGSGSTIMAYAGITSYNVQLHSDAYFTYRSIKQIQDNLATKTCPVNATILNTPPVVDAGADFSVPAGTAYVLLGDAFDAEGDSLTYCWEENDNSSPELSGPNSYASLNKPLGPNYRSFLPKTEAFRVMPEMQKVLSGALSSSWESVSNVGRNLEFALTVRDNNPAGPQTATDQITITSLEPFSNLNPNGVGPFAITSQNTADLIWDYETSQTITWTVNNTTSLPGSDRVKISLSIDGGEHFDYVLAADTPNDGFEQIIVPATIPASVNCRIKIEPLGHRYFAINNRSFYLGYEAISNCQTYVYDTSFAIPDGTSSFTARTIQVPDQGTITDVNIGIDLTHSNLADLTIAFIRPSGILANLYNTQCVGASDLNIVFDAQGNPFDCNQTTQGNYLPPTGFDINTINESNAQGNWQFGFKDGVAGNAGVLNKISLEICTRTYQLLGQNLLVKQMPRIYPNPSQGFFYLDSQKAFLNTVQIEITDLAGRGVYSNKYNLNGQESLALDLTGLSKGAYLMRLSENQFHETLKIIIK
ncbi:T9SS type A sorting domain-containing protein [Flavobacterium sp. CYK-4]|uniref:zinc-dependent metalloprotease n=1 Tax=Flavobacterium lotistagni TaxID=2709660 RepID=UPI00140D330C|nr:zinc-dependent metalloprotease family protein [Flavobacterium lotistagni]NHM06602.1 T9SS type A sorting domain-containing protein [Flavobacterium lotistagni]